MRRRAKKIEGPNDNWSDSDRNANRTAAPGSRPQKPATTSTIKMGGKSYGSSTMNYGGVAGGNPTRSASELRSRASLYESGKLQSTKSPKSAAAARTRASNIEGHNKMANKTKAHIHASILNSRRKKK